MSGTKPPEGPAGAGPLSARLRFDLLGPQKAWYADRELDLGPGKRRAVLAVLLLNAGRPVSTGQIVEAVWPEEPPANGTNVVQKYVAGLRRVFEPDRSPRSPGQVLTLTDAGYLLRVGPEAVDAVRFERGVHRARQRHAEGLPDAALGEVSAALQLWQGEPFTGFAGPFFEAARHRLVELRAVALETRADLLLELGRHRELVGELVELVAEFPVRERLRQQLMLALHRSGRQAEALAAYREFADLLRDDYGIEPGEVLQELHRRILRSDPALTPPSRPAEPPTPPVPAPAPLPPPEDPPEPSPPAPRTPVATGPARPEPVAVDPVRPGAVAAGPAARTGRRRSGTARRGYVAPVPPGPVSAVPVPPRSVSAVPVPPRSRSAPFPCRTRSRPAPLPCRTRTLLARAGSRPGCRRPTPPTRGCRRQRSRRPRRRRAPAAAAAVVGERRRDRHRCRHHPALVRLAHLGGGPRVRAVAAELAARGGRARLPRPGRQRALPRAAVRERRGHGR
ncbi:AfsR/SARP family transcriptional regulator [Micromonospora sp. R77]|uniref:AfsR/SARP family transcriptional regulator n=1 Tax=Micromonospora sp. R77 TaxID=2925836 RepID=UPI001F5FF9A0|nr:AfsR/SARP family transcriptional regulator [Micromonospora sp. R77]MCI4062847.1 AfsR/SARP family transcriptional regulator [Micromonospora sp. R77]